MRLATFHDFMSTTSPALMESLTPEQQALFENGGRLSDYDVLKPIGKGKFSVVFKALRRRDEQPVALKKIAIFDLMDARAREKTLKEVRLVQAVNHPNIIQYLDAFIENKELHIAFEWAEAGDLKRQIRKANEKSLRFEERTIWRYFSQLCDAIFYLHRARIMHRDLKPANIFLTLQGVVKVGDLGLGRHLSENTLEARSKVGTPLYMSPEVLRGEAYDWKSDVWSLGCILYELAMLRSPFKSEGLNLYGLFQKINKGEYEEIPPLYSEHLRQLVTRMISLVAAERPTMEEVWKWCEHRPSSASLERRPASREQKDIPEQQEEQLKQKPNSVDIGASPASNVTSDNVPGHSRVRSRPPSATPGHESSSQSRPPSSSSESRASTKADSSDVIANPEDVKSKNAERRMELLFDKLCMLQYEQALGKRISRKYFIGNPRALLCAGGSSDRSHFDDFTTISRWLLGRLGHDLNNDVRGEVPPIAMCQRLLIAAERVGALDVAGISPPSLIDGTGSDVCDFLDAMCEQVLRKEGVHTGKVLYPIDQIDSAEVQDDLEIVDDQCGGTSDSSDSATMSSPFEASDLFGDWLVARQEINGVVKSEAESERRQMIHSRIDPVMWGEETQRMAPVLRQKLAKSLSASSREVWESRLEGIRRLGFVFSDCNSSNQIVSQLSDQVEAATSALMVPPRDLIAVYDVLSAVLRMSSS